MVQQAEADMVDGKDLHALLVPDQHADFVLRADPVRQLLQPAPVQILDGIRRRAHLPRTVILIEAEEQRDLADPDQGDDEAHQPGHPEENPGPDVHPARQKGVPVGQGAPFIPFQSDIPLPEAS